MIAEACIIFTLTLTSTCLDDTLNWSPNAEYSTKLAYDGRLVFVDPGGGSHLIGCWEGTIRYVFIDATGTEVSDAGFFTWQLAPERFMDVDCSQEGG